MATLLADAVRTADGLDLTCVLSLRDTDCAAAGSAGVNRLADVSGPRPVVVDFTAPEATARLLEQAERTPCALVIGTSGLPAAVRDRLRALSQHRTVVWAANYSFVLALMNRFVRELAARADESWGAGILDVHFAGKRDRPSGTGSALAETWRAARGGRAAGVDILSLRIGDAVSEHRLIAAGRAEQVEICHRVNDRAAFAPGVLAAVRFADGAEPGLYTVEDALWA
jgi:4-hydroxy-tetrahydrodipicolinate reductase